MAISDHIERVRQNLREGRYHSEAAWSQGIVLPTLHELGWPVFNTSIVIPEYSIEGRRVDYALCHPESHPVVFIEVKKVGLSDGADRQLFEYAFMLGVPMAILTDGQEWSFYLPGEQVVTMSAGFTKLIFSSEKSLKLRQDSLDILVMKMYVQAKL
jgi:predicted type IV restriction endonuclease